MSEAEPPPFAISSYEADGATVLAFAGDLDVLAVEEARAAVSAAQRDGATVALDLRGLRFMDSSGLRVVLEADRRAGDGGGRLMVAPGAGAVRRVLDLSGVASIIELVDAPPGGDR